MQETCTTYTGAKPNREWVDTRDECRQKHRNCSHSKLKQHTPQQEAENQLVLKHLGQTTWDKTGTKAIHKTLFKRY